MSKFTVEKVRQLSRGLWRISQGALEYRADELAVQDAANMLTAYADLLDRKAAGVTDKIVNKALNAEFCGRIMRDCLCFGTDYDEEIMRSALTDVWPIAAEPVIQPDQSEFGHEFNERNPLFGNFRYEPE